MYYNPLLYKMIPGIFIVSNSKNYNGYENIFIFIKKYILSNIRNDIKKLNGFLSLQIIK